MTMEMKINIQNIMIMIICNMNNQVLSIEQMQELKELSIDTSKASAVWTAIFINFSTQSVSADCLIWQIILKLNDYDKRKNTTDWIELARKNQT